MNKSSQNVTIFLIMFILINMTTVNSNNKSTGSVTVISINQISYFHGDIDRDSVVLSGVEDSEFQYFSKIDIFRKGKKMFELEDKNMELQGFQGKCFIETSNDKGYFYIFTYNDRPLPNKYLIIKVESDSVYLFGITGNSTAEIFGDIDRDGMFEIGGYQDYNDKNIYVFEISDKFKKDKTLSDCLNKVIKIE